jgi:phage recombination protein Bet
MAGAIEISGYTASQIRIIKQTVAADTNDTEFNLFMEACRSYRLDPFRRQINAVVYNKNKPDKRKMSIIVSRDGLRILAQRCGDYRPASDPAQVIVDPALVGPLNPQGIVSVTVRLWKQDSRKDWYPVIGEAYWDEFAPVADEWAENADGKYKPTGKKKLEAGNWTKMPRLMLTKCAESQALRAGWPDEFGSVYTEEEMDRVAVNISASEALEEFDRAERSAKLGGPGILMVFDDTMVLEKVTLGTIADRCFEFIEKATPEEVHAFKVRNTAALQEFWAHDKGAALEVKKKIEAKEALMIQQGSAA